MSSTPQSRKPDRAHPDDPDELDVPTYRKRRPPRRKEPVDPYRRTGRAAPQEIPPREGVAPRPRVESEPTVAMPAAGEGAGERRGERRPGRRDAAVAAEPTAVMERPEADDAGPGAGESGSVPLDDEDGVERRGTINFGLFLLRLLTGAWFIIDALRTFFALGGDPGVAGLAELYRGELFHLPDVLSVAVPAAELAAGVFLVLGLVTPLFAAVGLTVAGFGFLAALRASDHGLAVFSWDADLWLPLLLAAVCGALIFTGPGTWGLDYARGWARRPLASAWIFAVISVVALVLIWWFCAGVNPLH